MADEIAAMREMAPESVQKINKLVAAAGARQRATLGERQRFEALARRSMDEDGTPLQFIKKARALLNAAAELGEAADDLGDDDVAPSPQAYYGSVELNSDSPVSLGDQAALAISHFDKQTEGIEGMPAMEMMISVNGTLQKFELPPGSTKKDRQSVAVAVAANLESAMSPGVDVEAALKKAISQATHLSVGEVQRVSKEEANTHFDGMASGVTQKVAEAWVMPPVPAEEPAAEAAAQEPVPIYDSRPIFMLSSTREIFAGEQLTPENSRVSWINKDRCPPNCHPVVPSWSEVRENTPRLSPGTSVLENGAALDRILSAKKQAMELSLSEDADAPHWDALHTEWAAKKPSASEQSPSESGNARVHDCFGSGGIGIEKGSKPAAHEIVSKFCSKMVEMGRSDDVAFGNAANFEQPNLDECNDFLDAFRVCALAYDPEKNCGVKSLYWPIWQMVLKKASIFGKMALGKMAPSHLHLHGDAFAARQIRQHATTLVTDFMEAQINAKNFANDSSCARGTAANAMWAEKVGSGMPPPEEIVVAAGVQLKLVSQLALVEQPCASNPAVTEKYISVNLARRCDVGTCAVQVSAKHADAHKDEPAWTMKVVAPEAVFDLKAVTSKAPRRDTGKNPISESLKRVLAPCLDRPDIALDPDAPPVSLVQLSDGSYISHEEFVRRFPEKEDQLAPKMLVTRSGVEEFTPEPPRVVDVPIQTKSAILRLRKHIELYPQKAAFAQMYFGAAQEHGIKMSPASCGLTAQKAEELADYVIDMEDWRLEYNENLIYSARFGYFSVDNVRVDNPDSLFTGGYLAFSKMDTVDRISKDSRLLVWLPVDRKAEILGAVQNKPPVGSRDLEKLNGHQIAEEADIYAKLRSIGGVWVAGLGGPMPMAEYLLPEATISYPKGPDFEVLTLEKLHPICSGEVADVRKMADGLLAPHPRHAILTGFRIVDLLKEALSANDDAAAAVEQLIAAVSHTTEPITIGDVAVALDRDDVASCFIMELIHNEPSVAARKRVMRSMAFTMATAGTWTLIRRLMGSSYRDGKKANCTNGPSCDLDCAEQPRTLVVAILDYLAAFFDPAETSKGSFVPTDIDQVAHVAQVWQDGLMSFVSKRSRSYTLRHVEEPGKSAGDWTNASAESKQKVANLNMGSALLEVVRTCIAGGLVDEASLQVISNIFFQHAFCTPRWMGIGTGVRVLMGTAAAWECDGAYKGVQEGPFLWIWLATTLYNVLSERPSRSRRRRRAAIVSCLLTGPCIVNPQEPLCIQSAPDGWFLAVIRSTRLVRQMEEFLDDTETACFLSESSKLEKLRVQWVSFKGRAEITNERVVAAEKARAAAAAEALLAEERGEEARLKREEAERRREKKQEQQARAVRIQENMDAAIAAAGVRRREQLDQQQEAFLSEWEGHLCSFIDQSSVNVDAYAQADTDKKRDVAKKRLLTRPEAFLALGEEKQTALRVRFAENVDELLSLHEAHKLHIKWVNQARKDAKRGSKQPAPPAKELASEEKEVPLGQQPAPDTEKKKRKNKGKKKVAPAASESPEEPAVEPAVQEPGSSQSPTQSTGPFHQHALKLVPAGARTLADVPGLTKPAAPESTIGGTTTCVVCFAGDRTHLFGPCGHVACCETCAPTFVHKPCPLCRARVDVAIRMHHA